MSRGFEDAEETSNEMLAEAVAKQLRPVYCARCGSRLQVRKLQQNGFDKDTGYPKYDVILACPHATLYETAISREAWFTWKNPFDRHTVHKVSKVIELNSDIADAHYKRGDAYDEMVELMKYCPSCGKSGVEGMKFCPQCGQRLASFDLEEKRRYVPEPEPLLTERNWFRRHLNWTLVSTWLICLPVAVVCVNIFRFTILSTLTISGASIILGIIAFTCGVLIWWATIWVIKQKGRSLLHLFWLLLPLGFIAILCLENKSLTHDASGNSMADYNKVIESDPANADAYYNRGDAYDEMGEYGKAIADYNKVIELDPNHTLAYYNRGCAYGEIGAYDKAIADYNKAIELNPNDALAYYNRGLAYREKGEGPKMVSDLEKCISLSTDPELTKDAQQALHEIKNSP